MVVIRHCRPSQPGPWPAARHLAARNTDGAIWAARVIEMRQGSQWWRDSLCLLILAAVAVLVTFQTGIAKANIQVVISIR